jgi:hypothetical protein
MSYCLILQDVVVRKVRDGGFSARVMREILDGCDRVGQDSNHHLHRVGPPDEEMQFDLAVHDEEAPYRHYLFIFSVKYDADEETLHVVNCDYLFEEISE